MLVMRISFKASWNLENKEVFWGGSVGDQQGECYGEVKTMNQPSRVFTYSS